MHFLGWMLQARCPRWRVRHGGQTIQLQFAGGLFSRFIHLLCILGIFRDKCMYFHVNGLLL